MPLGLHILKLPNSAEEKSFSIHHRALSRARTFRIAEADVIDSLREVEDDKTYRLFELTSVYAYATQQMKLSEDIACDLIAIMRKSRKVPELAQAIRAGTLTTSKARKILPVINESNKNAWLEVAMTQTSRAIEKAVVTECPRVATKESLRYKTSERLELILGVSEEWAALLARVKVLCSQKERAAVSSEDALMAAMKSFVEKNDPMQKAKRSEARAAVKLKGEPCEEEPRDLSVPGRINFARRKVHATVIHQVHLRDRHRCTHRNYDRVRCDSRRWLDIHHIVEVSEGGRDEVDNLTTLCREHHMQTHSKNE